MREQSPQQLVKRLKAKNRQALMEVYDLYAPPMFGFIKRNISNDGHAQRILENTFVKMWYQIDRFKCKNQRFFTWVLHIVKEEILHYNKVFNLSEAINQNKNI